MSPNVGVAVLHRLWLDEKDDRNKEVVIIGARPAGLTVTYKLREAGIASVVLDKETTVGGLSPTLNHRGYHFEISYHSKPFAASSINSTTYHSSGATACTSTTNNVVRVAPMDDQPLISVIVPVHNGGLHLGRCLDALLASSFRAREIIVVDDSSTDQSSALCRRKRVGLVTLARRSGPAAARNTGARAARGEILLFVDSDVAVRRDTLSRVAARLCERSGFAAVFGSYDHSPAERNFASQYKNLRHHFVHQHGNVEAETFWTGCGAIRREVFERLGGFNEERYREPSIEDIELGYRLCGAGYRILLDKELQVKHLKRWTLLSLVWGDIMRRAVPWSRLILERRGMINDLNLRTRDRASAVLVALLTAFMILSILRPTLLSAAALLLAATFILNRELFGFFWKRRGPVFALSAFFIHLLYYFYSGITFVACWSSAGFRENFEWRAQAVTAPQPEPLDEHRES